MHLMLAHAQHTHILDLRRHVLHFPAQLFIDKLLRAVTLFKSSSEGTEFTISKQSRAS